MKGITKCIEDIKHPYSSIFSTLDLTSGFWKMKLEEHSWQGPFSMDHISNGVSVLSHILSTPYRRNTLENLEFHRLHRQLPGPL
jgi:hypothetical protein